MIRVFGADPTPCAAFVRYPEKRGQNPVKDSRGNPDSQNN
jgi:hypothetical protein